MKFFFSKTSKSLHDFSELNIEKIVAPLLDDLYFTFENLNNNSVYIDDLHSAHISCNQLLNFIEQLKERI